MTTCREIVRAAYEEINALVGSEPDARDGELGMRRLNALIAGLSGMGIGEPLTDLEVAESRELPINCRAVTTAGGLVLTLPRRPQNGSRVQIIDAGADFSSDPVMVARNGRLLEGAAADLVANSAGFSRTWFYRADLADWRVVDEALRLEDDFPFPAATEDAFTVLLALRLAPPTGPGLTPESQAAVQRAVSSLRSRYRQTVRTAAEGAVLTRSAQAYPAAWRNAS
jgi:hypothetical protein